MSIRCILRALNKAFISTLFVKCAGRPIAHPVICLTIHQALARGTGACGFPAEGFSLPLFAKEVNLRLVHRPLSRWLTHIQWAINRQWALHLWENVHCKIFLFLWGGWGVGWFVSVRKCMNRFSINFQDRLDILSWGRWVWVGVGVTVSY